MMLKSKNTLLISLAFFIATGFTACKKAIDIPLKNAASAMVIEGSLPGNNEAAVVKISQSVPVSGQSEYPAVRGATVQISDASGRVYPLKEESEGIYKSEPLPTKYNVVYTLAVKAGSESYLASSVMPAQINLDTIYTANEEWLGKKVTSVSAKFKDPAGVANYYRFVLYVNNALVKRTFTESDERFDGRTSNVSLLQSDVEIKKGDKITIDMYCIDEKAYKYWSAISRQQGNGFFSTATLANPESNISNNALGYFSAYTYQRKSVILP